MISPAPHPRPKTRKKRGGEGLKNLVFAVNFASQAFFSLDHRARDGENRNNLPNRDYEYLMMTESAASNEISRETETPPHPSMNMVCYHSGDGSFFDRVPITSLLLEGEGKKPGEFIFFFRMLYRAGGKCPKAGEDGRTFK